MGWGWGEAQGRLEESGQEERNTSPFRKFLDFGVFELSLSLGQFRHRNPNRISFCGELNRAVPIYLVFLLKYCPLPVYAFSPPASWIYSLVSLSSGEA